jgi:tRNA modification GTPase
MNVKTETICAIATGNGIGAIAIVRVSGPDSKAILTKCFSKDLSLVKSHTLHFGTISDNDGIQVDEVLISYFEEGRSFTGEESIEISCHGSPYVQQQILRVLQYHGCRMAKPGEFTQRAFINGKLDLSQAEAVADLIAAQSKKAHQIALSQLKGNLSSDLKVLREELIAFASLIELELDFSEEDVEFADRTQLKVLVGKVLNTVGKLAASFALGNALKNGVPVAIVGAPNTGKSTLLNQLLGEDRAIVSDEAGTTRDVIEETLNIDGILFRLIDTAGIRETNQYIESMGIERSQQKIKEASIVLCLADATDKSNLSETQSWSRELSETHPDKKVLFIVNKSDLSKQVLKGSITISAKEGIGIDLLHSEMVSAVVGTLDLENDTIIANARHHEALLKTSEALEKAANGLEDGTTGDFIAMDIRQAMFHLGSITGDISTDDLLGSIFSKFCIGK